MFCAVHIGNAVEVTLLPMRQAWMLKDKQDVVISWVFANNANVANAVLRYL